MPVPNDIAGRAALSICEALLLALKDRNVLPENEILGILRDAAAAHESPQNSEEAQTHSDVAALINEIVSGGNFVRRS